MAALAILAYPTVATFYYVLAAKFAPKVEDKAPVHLELVTNEEWENAA